MKLEGFNVQPDTQLDHTLKKEKQKIRHFLPLILSHEQETSSALPSALDKGKGLLSPEEEKWRKSVPIGEDGKRAPKIVKLSYESTPEKPLGLGGMKSLKKLLRRETSRGGDHNLSTSSGEGSSYISDRSQLKPKDLSMRFTFSNEAYRLLRAGKYEEAEESSKRELAAMGLENPNAAYVLNNLALTYIKMGRYGEAERSFKRALDIGIDDHILDNLAVLYQDQGRFDEAEPLYECSLAMKLSNESPWKGENSLTADIRYNMANGYQEQKRYKKIRRFL